MPFNPNVYVHLCGLCECRHDLRRECIAEPTPWNQDVMNSLNETERVRYAYLMRTDSVLGRSMVQR
jgi:hypothetical protein